jgi:hypothetical protein
MKKLGLMIQNLRRKRKETSEADFLKKFKK